MRLQKILFVPDCHHPYVDKRAWNLLLRVGEFWQPNIIVTLGDFCDFYCVSSHDKSPDRTRNLADEILATNMALDQLDALGTEKKVYVAGNHEDRLERYLMTKAPELFDVVKISKLLELEKRGWHYVPYKEHYKIGKVFITHDAGNAGDRAHQKAEADFQGNTIIGHTHRLGYSVHGNAKGKAHIAAMFGWLGNQLQADYMHRIVALRDWALGFGLGYLREDSIIHITPVPIVNYSCVVDGVLFR